MSDALANPRRRLRRVVLTPNACLRIEATLGEGAIAALPLAAEVADPRRFPAPLDPGSVHQGAALEAEPLDWGPLDQLCDPAAAPEPGAPATVIALDRVTDPHNVGAILRSAEVFGARAVIAPRHHAAPESGALAKAASGALERQPYVRPVNLGDALVRLQGMGYLVAGLDGDATLALPALAAEARDRPLVLVLGAEGPGLRARTRAICDRLVRIEAASGFASLNVSNAAAIALYAATARNRGI
ncbi:MAG: RNA methyltransferase [Pseudomonadota bacterium]